MYCPISVVSFTCIFNELDLWSDISSEHPVFFKTVARLSGIKLPTQIVERLTSLNKQFKALNTRIKAARRNMPMNQMQYANEIRTVRNLRSQFLRLDSEVISFYPELKRFGRDNAAWQTLIDHVLHEQRFMYELFTNLKYQI